MVDQEVERVPDEDSSLPDDFADWVVSRNASLQRFAFLVTGSAGDAPIWFRMRYCGRIRDGRVSSGKARLRPTCAAASSTRVSRAGASAIGWSAWLTRTVWCQTATRTRRWPTPTLTRLGDFASMPPRQRAAVVLRFYEDMSFAQIGLVLDCPDATARSHVHRAIRTLRDRLAESEASHD